MVDTTKDSSEEQDMKCKLLDEFRCFTFSQAYYGAFSILRKGIKNGSLNTSKGTCHHNTLCDILNLPQLPSPARIMEFGGGTGTQLETICRRMEAFQKQAIVSVEEPYEEYLKQYVTTIESLSNACLDIVYSGPIQDYYGRSVEDLRAMKAYPERLQDRVLALHVLYHAINIFDQDMDPQKNLKQAASAMYTILKPGGEMVIHMAGHDEVLIGAVSLKCLESLFPNTKENFKIKYEVFRKQLFEGGFVEVLNTSFPMFTAKMHCEEVTYLNVLSTIEEVGASASVPCLHGLWADQSPFDVRVLQFCIDYAKSEGYKHGLYRDSKGMWCFPIKEYYITIKKVERE
ncbi:uncharacterized protein LOC106150565 isoform X1 [Lingula anatina]|uniref:Uncharacterized protein LOC106150565 isoform X1 n=2 Tax=Lingula anatina TaxID=7574 RepID=A0A1S3GYR1_LINAN|nr:uncharacterized protein LOC106150565 isoform X1 [Lingula anatina]|eukprot:XP_013378898.1 uncharacterized protein LOC106150565 isoform X1 [Lingula anatina]